MCRTRDSNGSTRSSEMQFETIQQVGMERYLSQQMH